MTTLSIELPPEVYERLRRIAGSRGKSIEDLAQTWIQEKSDAEPEPAHMRERLHAALRARGLLAEISDEEKRLAAESTLTLDEARAILDRVGGKPLSEVILEMRGPKE
jgi:predicted transcriptional regulator